MTTIMVMWYDMSVQKFTLSKTAVSTFNGSFRSSMLIAFSLKNLLNIFFQYELCFFTIFGNQWYVMLMLSHQDLLLYFFNSLS